MTDTQLYFSVGLPIIVNMIFNGFLAMILRDLWRAELRRVEEVIDARLKHLEGIGG